VIPDTLFEANLSCLPLAHRGKVRDIYGAGEEHLLIVTTDRLSAFDVVLPTPIPRKGAVLTAISNFWFRRTEHIVANHLTDIPLEQIVADPGELPMLEGRAVVVRKLQALPVEAIVRGYIIGSGWKDYQRAGAVCGTPLPQGLRLADRLPEPIYTPSTKAAAGDHDENIDFARTKTLLGAELAARVRDLSLQIYSAAAAYALRQGIIIADTKLEFGLSPAGELVLIDEVLTPDSSRFWPADTYHPGTSPLSFDKQYVRDYLENLAWDKRAPGPSLSPEVVANTSEKYLEAYRRLSGEDL